MAGSMLAAEAPTPIAEQVWIDAAPVSFLGLSMSSTMTLVKLGDGSLLVHSPVPLTAERRKAAEALGSIAHLYAPNLFHHLSIGQWAAALPGARVHGPRDLAQKRPDLRIDRTHGDAAEPAFAAVIDELPIDGFRLQETAVFHRPSGTLLLADLVHNVGRPRHGWTKFYTKTMGFYDRVALSRVLRWTSFSDRAAARRSLDRLLALPVERIVVGHGAPLLSGAREALAAAYSWLR